MFIGVHIEGVRRAVPLGSDTAERLEGAGVTVSGTCAEAGAVDAGLGVAIGAVARGIGDLLGDLRRRLALLEQMLQFVHDQPWIAPLFASEDELVAALFALADLSDRASLPAQLAAIVDRVENLSADREWMEQLDAHQRRQWLALVGARWLPGMNAVGASNCFEGLLRFFEARGAITPNSFCSVVDAVTLCGFQDGLARLERPRPNGTYEAGSDGWQRFFEHQRKLPAGEWDNRSFMLWGEAEQKPMEAGYRWAITRNADPSVATAVLTMGSELYRWSNRQRGQGGDPMAFFAEHSAVRDLLIDGMAAGPFKEHLGPWLERQLEGKTEAEMHWAFDPRNADATYSGAVALDGEVRQHLGARADESISAKELKQLTIAERKALDATGTLMEYHEPVEVVVEPFTLWLKGVIQ